MGVEQDGLGVGVIVGVFYEVEVDSGRTERNPGSAHEPVAHGAGTALRGGELVSAGGRVLNVTALGDSVAEARERAYGAVDRIVVRGVQYRHDIALRAVHARA